MTALIWIAIAWAAFSFLLYSRASLLTHSAAFILLLVAVMGWYDADRSVMAVSVMAALIIIVPLNVPYLRVQLLTRRILALYKKQMPRISSTEEEAIEAGTVWWDGELFSGDPDWEKLLRMPGPGLSDREQAFLDGPVEELCAMLDDWQITQELQDLPDAAWTFIKEHGFFGMIIPEQYGGLAFSAQAHSAVVMKVASRSLSTAVTIMVPNSLGPAELLLKYGTDEQKNYYLPRLAKGDEVPCFALTGPEAGSDAASIPDNGTVCRGTFDGRDDVLGIRLNWDKRYITLGPVATVLGLAFRLYDPDHLLGSKKDIGITLALIPVNTPGISIGSRHFPLNAAFQNGPNQGRDVFIPVDWIIGGQERAGDGWRMLMNCLAEGRSISLPALSTATGKLASRFTGAYARVRKQFNMPIGRFEGIEEALARIGGLTYLSDAARTLTARAVDAGEEPAVISAVVKHALTENARTIINDAMDITGGAGICMGPRNLLGRVYEAMPISITVEGANILTRSMIIFGQGIIRGHPYLLQEVNAAKNENRAAGLQEFDRAFMRHAGFILSTIARTKLLSITGSRLAKAGGSGHTRTYLRHLTRLSSGFAYAADATLALLGGALKRRERISARLADILSNLYLASAAIKRFEDEGRQEQDLPLLNWSCQYCLHNIQESFYDLFENYPSRIIGRIVRLHIFPYGKRFAAPSDSLDHQVAELLLSPGDARDRLTRGMFMPDSLGEALRQADEALQSVIRAEPVERKIHEAVKSSSISKGFGMDELDDALKAGVITPDEAQTARTAQDLRTRVVGVDDFPKDAWRKERDMVPSEHEKE